MLAQAVLASTCAAGLRVRLNVGQRILPTAAHAQGGPAPARMTLPDGRPTVHALLHWMAAMRQWVRAVWLRLAD